MTARTRAIRSYLFAPADNERILTKVLSAGADAVVVDLEDAVAPQAKVTARRALREWLERLPSGDRGPLWVRVNPVGGGLWRDDLEAVVGPWLASGQFVDVAVLRRARAILELIEALEARVRRD